MSDSIRNFRDEVFGIPLLRRAETVHGAWVAGLPQSVMDVAQSQDLVVELERVVGFDGGGNRNGMRYILPMMERWTSSAASTASFLMINSSLSFEMPAVWLAVYSSEREYPCPSQ